MNPVATLEEEEEDPFAGLHSFLCVSKSPWFTRNWVSELFYANSAIFLAITWREQVNFQLDDDEVCIGLDQHAKLDFYHL